MTYFDGQEWTVHKPATAWCHFFLKADPAQLWHNIFHKTKRNRNGYMEIQFLQYLCSKNAVWKIKELKINSLHVFIWWWTAGMLFFQIIQLCPPDLPMLDYFYFLDIWWVAGKWWHINHDSLISGLVLHDLSDPDDSYANWVQSK